VALVDFFFDAVGSAELDAESQQGRADEPAAKERAREATSEAAARGAQGRLAW
jgi:hypothetical protein